MNWINIIISTDRNIYRQAQLVIQSQSDCYFRQGIIASFKPLYHFEFDDFHSWQHWKEGRSDNGPISAQ
jgi:hypothetical protein